MVFKFYTLSFVHSTPTVWVVVSNKPSLGRIFPNHVKPPRIKQQAQIKAFYSTTFSFSFVQSERRILYISKILLSRHGLLGVESEYFSNVFVLREMLDASSQTYQAYRSSKLLPRLALNTFNVVLLVTDCWSTALIQCFLRQSPALQRVVTLLFDALISFGMVVAVPLMIFIPYVQAFSFEYYSFKDPDYLHDTTRLAWKTGIFLSLTALTELIGRSEGKVLPDKDGEKSPNPIPRSGTSIVVQKRSIKTNDGPTLSSNTLNQAVEHQSVQPEATGIQRVKGVGKEPCSSLVYDCHVRNTLSPDEISLEKVDPTTLFGLAIVHCPALQMPSNFQGLTSLMMMHVFNSTVVSWDDDSSIDAHKHTRLMAVFMRNIQMKELPTGMMQSLPYSLKSMRISGANLTALPSDLSTRWRGLVVVTFDDGTLKELTLDLFSINSCVLSFSGNRIETIPALARMPPGTVIPELRLYNNPLQELPAELMAPNSFIMSLNVQATKITNFPPWVNRQTRLCGHLILRFAKH